jgi:hypothetical protein
MQDVETAMDMTSSHLQSMLNSASGTQQLYSYREETMAPGGTAPFVSSSGAPLRVYKRQKL